MSIYHAESINTQSNIFRFSLKRIFLIVTALSVAFGGYRYWQLNKPYKVYAHLRLHPLRYTLCGLHLRKLQQEQMELLNSDRLLGESLQLELDSSKGYSPFQLQQIEDFRERFYVDFQSEGTILDFELTSDGMLRSSDVETIDRLIELYRIEYQEFIDSAREQLLAEYDLEIENIEDEQVKLLARIELLEMLDVGRVFENPEIEHLREKFQIEQNVLSEMRRKKSNLIYMFDRDSYLRVLSPPFYLPR